MSSPQIPPQDYALIESLVNKLPPKAQEDARSLFQGWSIAIGRLNLSTGNVAGQSTANVPTPPQASISVAASNAAFNITITPPSLNPPATLWHQVRYSPIKGFTSQVTELEPTTSTSMVLNLANQTLFFQVRSSYNKQQWNDWSLASESAAQSGLVSSNVTNEAGAFNQTNLAIVTSTAIGASAAIQVQGAGGPLTSMVRVKGTQQLPRPGATIVGITPATTRYVGYNGAHYVVRPTLAALFADHIEPVGKVSVVGTGVPTLPTIVPIISGGHIIGYNVTAGGNGASAPYTLTITDPGGPGTGATTGDQTIVAGVLISVAPGNPGQNYDGSTVVTPSGGIFPGTAGGGTAEGDTNGRLTI